MAMLNRSSLASQPLAPMDERYGLLTAIVSSSNDGAAPQHVTFMGPGLELVLQSRPVEPSQARSGNTVEYVFSIDYQGLTKVSVRPGQSTQAFILTRQVASSFSRSRAAAC
jgi:hypothetical protein